MTILFDGIELNPSLQWANRFQYSPVVQSLRRTLGGKLYITNAVVQKGRPIVLQATEETGWLIKDTVDALETRAYMENTSFTFDFHGDIHTVMFDHSNPPAVNMTLLNPKVPLETGRDWGDPDGTYFIGTINLFTV